MVCFAVKHTKSKLLRDFRIVPCPITAYLAYAELNRSYSYDAFSLNSETPYEEKGL